MRNGFLLAGVKARWDKWGGRILLGDNTGVGEDMLRPIGSRLSLDFSCTLLYICI